MQMGIFVYYAFRRVEFGLGTDMKWDDGFMCVCIYIYVRTVDRVIYR